MERRGGRESALPRAYTFILNAVTKSGRHVYPTVSMEAPYESAESAFKSHAEDAISLF